MIHSCLSVSVPLISLPCTHPSFQTCQIHRWVLTCVCGEGNGTPLHTPLLPGKSQEQRSLVGCSPWGCKESDTTEQLHFNFSLWCIGEENGKPFQCSCLENLRDEGAWWLPSMVSHRVGHYRSDLAAAAHVSVSCILLSVPRISCHLYPSSEPLTLSFLLKSLGCPSRMDAPLLASHRLIALLQSSLLSSFAASSGLCFVHLCAHIWHQDCDHCFLDEALLLPNLPPRKCTLVINALLQNPSFLFSIPLSISPLI